MSLLIFLGIIFGVGLLGFGFLSLAPQIGADADERHLERMQSSPNYRDGKFRNQVPTELGPSAKMMGAMWDFFRGAADREPTRPIPTVPLDKGAWSAIPAEQPAVVWLGHSTLLIKIGGKTLLTDPVFSERASMFSFAGPKRFPYQPPISVEDLPPADAVIISHDHYDHLDYQTILKIHPKVKQFLVPLGVGAHLEKWGVPAEKIMERDWWDTVTLDSLELTMVPTRHFSGRGLMNRNTTLWCGWAIRSGNHNTLYGGDSGYFPGFREIGEKLGPFDLVMLECGAYSQYWPSIHMMPEETAQAAADLQARQLLPIHWGKFNLSLHPWKEPVERLLQKATELKLNVITPQPGELVRIGSDAPQRPWWRSVELAQTEQPRNLQFEQNQ